MFGVILFYLIGAIVLVGITVTPMLACFGRIDAKWCILPVIAFFAYNLSF